MSAEQTSVQSPVGRFGLPATTLSGHRIPMVLGNWKMHGDMVANEACLAGLLAESDDLLQSGQIQAGLAVPAPYLFQVAVRGRGRGLGWGGQDVSDEALGAFTGEVSAAMLADFECGFALVGHSERRARHAETDQRVAGKLAQLQAQGVLPVLCVGESLQEREQGQAQAVVCGQIRAALAGRSAEQLQELVVAYEPIWAIGSGQAASAVEAQAMHAAIRDQLTALHPTAQQTRILYGGSVKAAEAEQLFLMADIDGALVGGASLQPTEMSGIFRAAASRASRLQSPSTRS